MGKKNVLDTLLIQNKSSSTQYISLPLQILILRSQQQRYFKIIAATQNQFYCSIPSFKNIMTERIIFNAKAYIYIFSQDLVIQHFEMQQTKCCVLFCTQNIKFSFSNNFYYFLLMYKEKNLSSKLGWDSEEQKYIQHLHTQIGIRSWKKISEMINQKFEGRTKNAKQCRERYINYIKFQGNQFKINCWTQDEDKVLFQSFMYLGSKWSELSQKLNRSQNDVKNRFYGLIKKLLRKINTILRNDFYFKKGITQCSFFRLLQTNTEELQIQQKEKQKSCYTKELKYEILNCAKNTSYVILQKQAQTFAEKFSKFNSLTKNDRLKICKSGKITKRKGMPPLFFAPNLTPCLSSNCQTDDKQERVTQGKTKVKGNKMLLPLEIKQNQNKYQGESLVQSCRALEQQRNQKCNNQIDIDMEICQILQEEYTCRKFYFFDN